MRRPEYTIRTPGLQPDGAEVAEGSTGWRATGPTEQRAAVPAAARGRAGRVQQRGGARVDSAVSATDDKRTSLG